MAMDSHIVVRVVDASNGCERGLFVIDELIAANIDGDESSYKKDGASAKKGKGSVIYVLNKLNLILKKAKIECPPPLSSL